MLGEAVEVIRMLWEGGFVNHRGTHFEVESAKLYDLPSVPPRIGIAGSGKQSTELAAELGDFLIATEPKPDIVSSYGEAGGTGEAVGQFPVCFGEPSASLRLLHEQFRWGGLGWKVKSELPGTSAFEAATEFVREEDLSSFGVWGTEVEPYVDRVRAFVGAGFSRVSLVQVGDAQAEFCEWYASTLKPALAKALG
jgi:G6PDH family F420-dependent oxidoreductase